MRFAYADPPYFKHGKRLYGKLHEQAAHWDSQDNQRALIDRLKTEFPDGWTMSCNPADLHWLLEGHEDIRICAWTKTFHQIRGTSVQYAWEPVLLFKGRYIKAQKPMVRDWLAYPIAMKKGLVGAKPDKFNDWILQLLGFQKGDEMVDLFPGTGGMSEAVARINEN